MKRHSIKIWFLMLCLVVSGALNAEGPNSEKISETISLKGFSKFVVFPMIPSSNKTLTDKLNTLVEQALSKEGKVNKMTLIVETPTGEAIDLSGLRGDGTLIYEINNVLSPEGKDLDIIKASLSLSTNVTSTKTKGEGTAILWSSECYIKGNVQKDAESLVSKSIDLLLKKFDETYKKVNSDKPTFNFYAA